MGTLVAFEKILETLINDPENEEANSSINKLISPPYGRAIRGVTSQSKMLIKRICMDQK